MWWMFLFGTAFGWGFRGIVEITIRLRNREYILK